MTLVEFSADQPLVPLVGLCALGFLFYVCWVFYKQLETGLSALTILCIVGVIFMFFESYKGALREASTRTVVVMPNKQNLRLGEDGSLAFCLDGIARNWEGTTNGVVSTSIKRYMGRPMKCLSIEQSVIFLKERGATSEEIENFRNAYKITFQNPANK